MYQPPQKFSLTTKKLIKTYAIQNYVYNIEHKMYRYTEVYIDTCIDLSCIAIHQYRYIIPSLIPMLKNVDDIAKFRLSTDNQCNTSIYHTFHHVDIYHTHAYILVSD